MVEHRVLNMPGERISPDERIRNLFRDVSQPLKGKFAHQITDYRLTPEQRQQITTSRSGYKARGHEGLLGARWLPASEAILRLRQNLPAEFRLDSSVIGFDLMEEIANMVEGYYARRKVVRTIEFVMAVRVLENLAIVDRSQPVTDFSDFKV